MVKRIAPHFVDTLQDRVDLVSVINARVPLKKAGKDYQACCPFHNENTPSFTVSAQKQFYYCFGCGAKGGAINFIMDFEHLSFVESIELLSEESGLEVEYEQLSKAAVEKIDRQKTLQELLDETAHHYSKNLYQQSTGNNARQYLSERQLDKETSDFFRLGYSQGGNHLERLFGSAALPSDLQKTGLLGQGDNGFYDFFRDRLMFPIRDVRGRVVGFGARALGDAKPKYLNTGDTELFNKSQILYGLYEELQTNRNIDHLIVVEGYMDVIALHQMGIQGAVAALGTAFTQGHLNIVRKYSKKIFFCFDGDKAGKKAARRAVETILPAMTTDTEIRMVFLPDGEDPDTLVRKIGKAAFQEILNTSQYFSEFVCETIIGDSDLSLIEGRGEMALRAKSFFELLPEGAYKNALHEELTERAGRDIYTLVDETQAAKTDQPNDKKLFFRSNQAKKPHQSSSSSLESLLIRFLIELPYLADFMRHEELLKTSAFSDREVLLRLLQFLQLNHFEKALYDNGRLVHELMNFEPHYITRMQQIIQSEQIEIIRNESYELRNQRIQQAFLSGTEKLLNTVQRKNAFADLKNN